MAVIQSTKQALVTSWAPALTPARAPDGSTGAMGNPGGLVDGKQQRLPIGLRRTTMRSTRPALTSAFTTANSGVSVGVKAAGSKAEDDLRKVYRALSSRDQRIVRCREQFQIDDQQLQQWLQTGETPRSVLLAYEFHRRASEHTTVVSAAMSTCLSLLLRYGEAVARVRGEHVDGKNQLLETVHAMQAHFWAKEYRVNAQYTATLCSELKRHRSQLALAERTLATLNEELRQAEKGLASPANKESDKTQKRIRNAQATIARYTRIVAHQEHAARAATKNLYELHAKRVQQSTPRHDRERVSAGRYAAAAAVVEANVAPDTQLPCDASGATTVMTVSPATLEAVRWVRRVAIVNPEWAEDGPTRAAQMETLEAIRPKLQAAHQAARQAPPAKVDDDRVVASSRDYATTVFSLSEAYEAEAYELDQQQATSKPVPSDPRLSSLFHNAAMLALEVGDIELTAANARAAIDLAKKSDSDQEDRVRRLRNIVVELDQRVALKNAEIEARQAELDRATPPTGRPFSGASVEMSGGQAGQSLYKLFCLRRLHHAHNERAELLRQRDEFSKRLHAGAWPEHQRSELEQQLAKATDKTTDKTTGDNLRAKMRVLEKQRQAELDEEKDRADRQRRIAAHRVDLIAGEEFLAAHHRASPMLNLHGDGPGEPYANAYADAKRQAVKWHQREVMALRATHDDSSLEQQSAELVFSAALFTGRPFEERYETSRVTLAGGADTESGQRAWETTHGLLEGGPDAVQAASRLHLNTRAETLAERYTGMSQAAKAVHARAISRALHAYAVVREPKTYAQRARILLVLREAEQALSSAPIESLDGAQRMAFAKAHGLAGLDAKNHRDVKLFALLVNDDLAKVSALRGQAALASLEQLSLGEDVAFGDSTGFHDLREEIEKLAAEPHREQVRARYLSITNDLRSGIDAIEAQMKEELAEQESTAIAYINDAIAGNYRSLRESGGFVLGTVFGHLGHAMTQDRDQRHAAVEVQAITDDARRKLHLAVMAYRSLASDEHRLTYVAAARGNNPEMLAELTGCSRDQAKEMIEAWQCTHTGQLFLGVRDHEGSSLRDAATRGVALSRALPAHTLGGVADRVDYFSAEQAATVAYLDRHWAAVQATDVVTLMLMGGALRALGGGVATWASRVSKLAEVDAAGVAIGGATPAALATSRGVLSVDKDLKAIEKWYATLTGPLRTRLAQIPGAKGIAGRFAYDLAYYRAIGVTLDAVRAQARKSLGKDSVAAHLTHLLVMMTKLGGSMHANTRVAISAGFEVGIEKLYREIDKLPDKALANSGGDYLSLADEEALQRRVLWWHYLGRFAVDVTKIMVRRGRRLLAAGATPSRQASLIADHLRSRGAVVQTGTVIALASALRGYTFSLCEVGHFRESPSVFKNYRRSLLEALGNNAGTQEKAALREYLDDQLWVLATERSGLTKYKRERGPPSAELLSKCIKSIAADALALGLVETQEEAEQLACEQVTSYVLLGALSDSANNARSGDVSPRRGGLGYSRLHADQELQRGE